MYLVVTDLSSGKWLTPAQKAAKARADAALEAMRAQGAEVPLFESNLLIISLLTLPLGTSGWREKAHNEGESKVEEAEQEQTC